MASELLDILKVPYKLEIILREREIHLPLNMVYLLPAEQFMSRFHSFKCLNLEYQVWLCPYTSGKCFRCHKDLLLLWVCFLNKKCDTFCRSGPQIHMALCHQTLTWGNSYWLQIEIEFERSLPFLSRVPWWEFITAVISWRTTQH